MAGAIRLGERFRSPLQDAYWNHCAIVIEPSPFTGRPRVVEATGNGVVVSFLSDLGVDIVCTPVDAYAGLLGYVDRLAVVEQANALVGAKYGWLTILSIVLNLLTPRWIKLPDFRQGATFICSAAAAFSLHAGGADLDTSDIYQIFPSELRGFATYTEDC